MQNILLDASVAHPANLEVRAGAIPDLTSSSRCPGTHFGGQTPEI